MDENLNKHYYAAYYCFFNLCIPFSEIFHSYLERIKLLGRFVIYDLPQEWIRENNSEIFKTIEAFNRSTFEQCRSFY